MPTISVRDALELLGLQPPKLKKGMTQKQADELVRSWRDEVLDKAVRKAQKKHHPDAGGEEEKFKQIPAAREAIEERLRLRVRKTACDECGTEVADKDDAFCRVCGTPRKALLECPCCGASREPGQRFCASCGYLFGTALDARLRSLGWKDQELRALWRDRKSAAELNRASMRPDFSTMASVLRKQYELGVAISPDFLKRFSR